MKRCALLLPLLAGVAEVAAIAPELEEEARRATVGEDGALGYSERDLSLFDYPCRMPVFFDLIEDTFRFEEKARALGFRFAEAPETADLLREAWTAGGFDIAAADELAPPSGEPLEALDRAAREIWEAAGEDPPPGLLADVEKNLPARAVLPLARFLARVPPCIDAWARAVEAIPADPAEHGVMALRYHEVAADAEALRLLEREFDRAWGGRAAVDFVAAAEILARELDEARLSARLRDVRIPTPHGDVLLGASGKSEHGAEPLLLLVDVSGDDRYLPGSACGSGAHPFCAVIDVRGEDCYEATGEPGGAGAGAGVAGVGIVIDLRGDDRWLAEQYGAGFGIVGAGIVHDVEGNDRYVGDHLCQAVGLAGVGMILDEEGDDEYELFSYGQGLGQPLGAGVLVDRAGSDTYVARDDEVVSPSAQTKEHNTSMAQGAGYGLRSDSDMRWVSGGIGLLLDHAGDDEYSGAVFAQAVGYWFGVGLLFDLDGNDAYSAVWYGQSASAHYALSYMLDAKGNDRYETTMSQSLGGGTAISPM